MLPNFSCLLPRTGHVLLQRPWGCGATQVTPALTFSPSTVRMLSALGTRSAVLAFLKMVMEETGITT